MIGLVMIAVVGLVLAAFAVLGTFHGERAERLLKLLLQRARITRDEAMENRMRFPLPVRLLLKVVHLLILPINGLAITVYRKPTHRRYLLRSSVVGMLLVMRMHPDDHNAVMQQLDTWTSWGAMAHEPEIT